MNSDIYSLINAEWSITNAIWRSIIVTSFVAMVLNNIVIFWDTVDNYV
jgi:hypothetical protein